MGFHLLSQVLLSLTVSFQFLTFSFFRSSITSSCHHCFGLPIGLIPIGFQSSSLLAGLAWTILWICPSHFILCALMTLTISAPSINQLTPNNPYSGRTALLTSKRCILYIYSTNTGTEYFKHGIYSPFFSLQNAVCFIILTYLVPVLFTFYIQCVLKFKKIIQAPKG